MAEAEKNEEVKAPSNFIHDFIDEDLAEGKYSKIQTRFPPEPNGFHQGGVLLEEPVILPADGLLEQMDGLRIVHERYGACDDANIYQRFPALCHHALCPFGHG